MADRVALLLEDEALIVLDIEMALLAKGFSVFTAASCARAHEWLAANEAPDVAIIDVGLADGPSHSVAAYLVTKNVPMIMHSGRSGPQTPEDAIFAHAVWISKPSYSDDLIGAVERAISDRDGGS